ncbi:MAG: hypothetical protein AAB536_01290 [Patescibacteria group bacterium]
MVKKDIIIAAAAIVIVGAGWLFYSGQRQFVQQAITQQTTDVSASAAQAKNLIIGQFNVAMVTYTDKGFSPSVATIPKGGVVIFGNFSSKNLRMASNPHPSHEGYPTTNGCVGSTFDSCSNIPPKVSWSFIFNVTGAWGYHNHLNPGMSGIVVVE